MLSSQLSIRQVEAIGWTFGSIAVVLTGGRLAIRVRITRGLHSDDAAHLAAVGMMLATLAIFSSMVPTIEAMAAGAALDADALSAFVWKSVTLHLVFFLSIWAVKLAFLLFYRLLFKVSRAFSVAWWVVLAYNAATLLAAILCALLLCNGDLSSAEKYRQCRGAIVSRTIEEIYAISFVCIATSDLLTMALPLVMLHRLHMSAARKAGVATLVALSTASIALDATRIAMLMRDGGAVNELWVLLEVTLVTIVSALPVYYSLPLRRFWRSCRARATLKSTWFGSDSGSGSRSGSGGTRNTVNAE